MRIDKLTTKFQQALADAQSMAVGGDNPFVEPVHVLAAMLAAEDTSSRSLLERSGVNITKLREGATKAIARLPKVEGHGGETPVSRELSGLMRHLFRDERLPSGEPVWRPSPMPPPLRRPTAPVTAVCDPNADSRTEITDVAIWEDTGGSAHG